MTKYTVLLQNFVNSFIFVFCYIYCNLALANKTIISIWPQQTSSNNALFPFRPEEIKETSLEDRKLLLDFETVPLASCPRTTLVLTNTSAIRARFSLEMDHFKAAKPPTPPEGEYID